MTRIASFVAAVAALAFGFAMSAAAQEKFPAKTIDVVTHAGPGGGTDITTRLMMIQARKHLGVDMAVVSKPGGSGGAALKYVHQQPRDGYTIFTMTQSHLFQIAQGKGTVSIDDLVGVARATDDPQIVMVRTASGIKSYEDLVKAGKAKTLKWGATFVGGVDHVAIHNFAKRAGIPYTVVPFRGGGDIVVNLVGGNVDVAMLNYSEAESQIQSKEVLPLVTLAAKRIASLPDTPTGKEKGIDYIASTVRGFVALRGVPEDRLDILEKGIVKAMGDPLYQNYLTQGGMASDSVLDRKEWTAQIRALFAEAETSLKDLGIVK